MAETLTPSQVELPINPNVIPARFTQLIDKGSFPVMREQFTKNVKELINATAGEITLTGHTRPDDDAICAVLAQKRILAKQFPDKSKKVKAVISDRRNTQWDQLLLSPDEIIWAADTKVKSGDKDREGDVTDYVKPGDTLICLDQSEISSFSRVKKELDENPTFHTVFLDHHRQTPSRASVSYTEPEATSTCELIARMNDIDKLDPDVAGLLAIGMHSDTRGFSFKDDYGDTKEIFSKLVSKSGKTIEELLALVPKSEQQKAFEDTIRKNIVKIQAEGKPTITAAYITDEQSKPDKNLKTHEVGYDLLMAKRQVAYELQALPDTGIAFVISPMFSKNPKEMRYTLMLRNGKQSSADLNKISQDISPKGEGERTGGGHGNAASGTFILDEAGIREMNEKKQADPNFNQMHYVIQKAADKIGSLMNAKKTT